MGTELPPAGGVRVRAKPERPASTVFERLRPKGEPPLTIEAIRVDTKGLMRRVIAAGGDVKVWRSTGRARGSGRTR